MEVSKRAVAVLAVLAAGSLFVAFLRGGNRPPLPVGEEEAPNRRAIRALSDSVARLALRLRAEGARTRVDSAIAMFPAGRAPQVLVLGDSAPARLAAAARKELETGGFPSDRGVAVRLALLEGPQTTPIPPGVLRSFTLLPGLSGSGNCTAVRVVIPTDARSIEDTVGMLQLRWGGALGPCWYLATFGAPGRGVRAWLDSRYWDVAAATPPRVRVAYPRDETQVSADPLLRMAGDVLGVFSRGSATLEGCVGNRPELCEGAFLSPLPPGLLPPGIVASEQLLAAAHVPTDWLLGLPSSASRSLLAMMVEDLGRDRFAAFWASEAPVAEAFQAAAGESLGKWYQGQLRRELREAGFPGLGHPIVWPSAIGLLVLALGAALWGAERRQVR